MYVFAPGTIFRASSSDGWYTSARATMSALGFCARNPSRNRPREPGPIMPMRTRSRAVSLTSENADSHGLVAASAPAPIMPRLRRNSLLLMLLSSVICI